MLAGAFAQSGELAKSRAEYEVASLVLGAALGRTHDFAMRTALGASRGRLIRGVFVEMLVMSAAGAVLGVAAAAAAMRAIASLETSGIPLLDQTRVDVSALTFTATPGTGCTFEWKLDGTVVQTGASNTYSYAADPDTSCHTVTVKKTCGSCEATAHARVTQCVSSTIVTAAGTTPCPAS